MAPSRNFSSHSDLSQMAVGALELIKVQVFVDGRLEQVRSIPCIARAASCLADATAHSTLGCTAVSRALGLQGWQAPVPECSRWIRIC